MFADYRVGNIGDRMNYYEMLSMVMMYKNDFFVGDIGNTIDELLRNFY